MAEYIEREALVELIAERNRNTCNGALSCLQMKRMVKSIPAADVAPVRHGKWIGIEYDGYADGVPVYDLWECSECGEEVRGDDVPDTRPWCHRCGAKMDKEDTE